MIKGELPWQNVKTTTGEFKEKWIMEKKMKISVEELCEGLPYEIENILYYCTNLSYDAQPDYRYIQRELNSIIEHQCVSDRVLYDWMDVQKKRELQKEYVKIKLYPKTTNN